MDIHVECVTHVKDVCAMLPVDFFFILCPIPFCFMKLGFHSFFLLLQIAVLCFDFFNLENQNKKEIKYNSRGDSY